jgi:hypothetical protein
MKYKVNPVKVRMNESAKGVIYKSIVAMGFRARQINDNIKMEIANRMSTILEGPETEGANFDQIAISREFDKVPKPTFLSMGEISTGRLKFDYPEDMEPTDEY